jgi:hypothetical protein
MVRKVLEGCPSCGGRIEIGEVHCTRCDTQVRARYRPCDFCALTEEQSTFLRIFVLSRGNLSEVEKRLGVSYPTVRAKLDEIIERLGSTEVGSLGSSVGISVPRRRPASSRTDSPPLDVSRPENQEPLAGSQATPDRRRILEAVERGEISAAEGLASLHGLGGGHEDEG